MNTSSNGISHSEKNDNERLDGLPSANVLTLDFVSALAGDRPFTKEESPLLDEKKRSFGDRFFSDVLFAITHQHFEADIAGHIWQEIVRHKYEMSAALKRNIRVVVAALDYLSNIMLQIL
jgi:hypothetical protein